MAVRRKCVIAAAELFVLILAVSSFGAVRFELVGSPTEVINTGRSEVIGSINLVVRGAGNVTGTAAGGAAQIGIILDPAVQIDNTTASGIKLVASPGFAAANPTVARVENIDIGGQCAGFLTINIGAGVSVSEGDFIRLEGIRARIDASRGIVPGTDLYADLQSINDPSANIFGPDRVRIAKTLKGMNVDVVTTSASYGIRIAEAFARAFVDSDASNDGVNANDRTDSDAAALGAPTNSTQVLIRITAIPEGISDVKWPVRSSVDATGAALYLLKSSFSDHVATATYSFESVNQVNTSDVALESFFIQPGFVVTGERCTFDGFSSSITLAPAVPAAGACEAPGNFMRPRFLEQYELTVTELQPSKAVVNGPAFTLVVHGSGFVPGSAILWNGTAVTTTLVDSTTLTADIPATSITKVGTVTVSVANPVSSGGSAKSTMFSIVPPALSLYYPRLVAADAEAAESNEFTGIALANISGRIAELKLTAFDRAGNKIAGVGITNPAPMTLKAGEQKPLIDSQIFGAGLRKAAQAGWIKVEGNVEQVVGFFLGFNGTLTRLDGADVSSKVSSSFVLPEIEAQGPSQLSVANPSDDDATVRFDLVQADGTVKASASRTIKSNGVLAESVADLFEGTIASRSDYVRASASDGVVALEYLGKTAKDVAALNGQDAASGASILYSPQFVAGGADWETSLSVVNLSAKAANVTFRFVGDDGVQIGATRTMSIAAQGKILIEDPKFFLDTGSALQQGYVAISSDGAKLSGDVLFGNAGSTPFATALPLVSTPRSEMVFGQVASNETFFTGMAVLNLDQDPVSAVLRVYDNQGELVASRIVTIPGRGRVSQLLTQFFPELKGRNIGSGYMVLTSNRSNLVGFALFGANNLSVLSAVPAQILP
jgi:hypothetical protein